MAKVDDKSGFDAIIDRLSKNHGLSGEDIEFLLAMFGNPGIARGLCVSRLIRYLNGQTIKTTPNEDQLPRGFDSEYYLEIYPELQCLNCHPVIHYAKNGRKELRNGSKYNSNSLTRRNPTVTAVVPNYNHAEFLAQRLESINNQKHQVDEIILLDDASTDESLRILSEFALRNPDRCRLDANLVNSGNVFSQWEKAWNSSNSEIVWICESDDFCEPDFLKEALPLFSDPSVNIVFGDIQMCDVKGQHVDFLDFYRSHACPSLHWDKKISMFTHDWLKRGFAIKNILPNASGVLVRKTSISPKIWKEIKSYRVCGDWIFYLECAGAGKIAYSPAAKSFFRQHSSNTSVSFGKTHAFFQEHIRVWNYLESLKGPSSRQDCYRFKFHMMQNISNLRESDHDKKKAIQFCINSIQAKAKTVFTIGIVVQSLEVGGGEIFPIALANHLYTTSDAFKVVLIVASNFSNPSVEQRIAKGIPVVYLSDYKRDDYNKLIEDCGIDIINTHSSHCEFILLPHMKQKRAWVSSLHGGYDSECIAESHLSLMNRHIDVFTYLSPKNLAFTKSTDLKSKRFFKVKNAVCSYPELIGAQKLCSIIKEKEESNFTFAFAARGIPEKGWQFIVDAVMIAKKTWAAASRIKVLMCGDSEYVRGLSESVKNQTEIAFLGSVADTVSVFSYCDCVLLPTVFKGESLPLVLLEALAANKPIIATDIGEIRDLVCPDDSNSAIGWLIECRDQSRIASDLSEVMRLAFQQGPDYTNKKENTKKRSLEYSIGKVARQYEDIYLRAYWMRHQFMDSQAIPGAKTVNFYVKASTRPGIADLKDILTHAIDRKTLQDQDINFIETLIANDKLDEVPASCLDTYKLFETCSHRKLSIYDLCSIYEDLDEIKPHKQIAWVDAIKTLRRLGYSPQQPLARRLLDSLIIKNSHNLAIVAIPKNGSTALINMAAKLDVMNDTIPVEMIHASKISLPLQQPLFQPDPAYFTAGIIREPLSRFISTFLNKYASPTLAKEDLCYRDKFCKYAGKDYDSVTFKDFVRYASSIDLFADDPHLAPQLAYLPAIRGLDYPIVLTDAGELRHTISLGLEACEQSHLLNSALKSLNNLNSTYYSPIQICEHGSLYDMPVSIYSRSRIKPTVKELCCPEALDIILNIYQGDFECYQSVLEAHGVASRMLDQLSSLSCGTIDH